MGPALIKKTRTRPENYLPKDDIATLYMFNPDCPVKKTVRSILSSPNWLVTGNRHLDLDLNNAIKMFS